MIELSLADIEIYRNRYANILKLSKSALTVLNCFKSSPEKRLQVAFVVEETGLPRRTVQYAINHLVKKEFLQRLGQGAGSRYQLIF